MLPVDAPYHSPSYGFQIFAKITLKAPKSMGISLFVFVICIFYSQKIAYFFAVLEIVKIGYPYISVGKINTIARISPISSLDLYPSFQLVNELKCCLRPPPL
jgi:hypothetical protein